jgi:hypothetical protein
LASHDRAGHNGGKKHRSPPQRRVQHFSAKSESAAAARARNEAAAIRVEASERALFESTEQANAAEMKVLGTEAYSDDASRVSAPVERERQRDREREAGLREAMLRMDEEAGASRDAAGTASAAGMGQLA